MKASPEDIARYEKLAKERGGTVGNVPMLTPEQIAAVALAPEQINISEEEFLGLVLELAKRNGWKRAHFRPARERCKYCRGKGIYKITGEACKYCKGTGDCWRTAVQGDGKGFLDNVFVRERVVWAELKAEGKRMTMDQLEWAAALERAGQEVYCWYPSEWAEIEKVLR